MTREEATQVLNNLVEQVQGTPELHRQLWQAIETLNEATPVLNVPEP